MQISKLYLVVCAAALCGGVVTVRADDNPAQAAARAALEEKMRDLNAQPEATNAQPSVPPKSAQPARPATTAAPANRPPVEKPQTAAPATSGQPANAVTVAPSRAAVHEPTNPPPAATVTMPSTQPPTEKPAMTAAPRTAPPKTTKPATSRTASSDHGLFAPVPPPSGGAPTQSAPEKNMQPPTAPAAAPTAAQTSAPAATPSVSREPPQSVNANFPGKGLGLKPIVAPPLPISPMQQAQLKALLEKYDANAITPEQYQGQRAKILAEPK